MQLVRYGADRRPSDGRRWRRELRKRLGIPELAHVEVRPQPRRPAAGWRSAASSERHRVSPARAQPHQAYAGHVAPLGGRDVARFLTGSSRAHLSNVRGPLGRLLDRIAERKGDLRAALATFTNGWLASRSADTGLDWRWYFVRYAEMRAGRSGIHASPTGALGYRVCMLEKKVMSSYYRDPYLSAIREQSGVADGAVEGSVAQHWGGGPWFSGYETEARWMRLRASARRVQYRHTRAGPPPGSTRSPRPTRRGCDGPTATAWS